jgi:NAD-dependent SIR2 family protein deacetylase
MTDTQHVDGNALAGPLREIFAVDLTAAVGTCAHCRARGPLAEAVVFTQAPGVVARCARCGEVVLRLVHGPRSAWLDMHGLASVEIRLPA